MEIDWYDHIGMVSDNIYTDQDLNRNISIYKLHLRKGEINEYINIIRPRKSGVVFVVAK